MIYQICHVMGSIITQDRVDFLIYVLKHNSLTTKHKQYTSFLIVTHCIIAYSISLVNVQTNFCNNNLLILDVKQLNKIMKLYDFYTLKVLWDGQGKIKMYYRMSRVKKQLSAKRSFDGYKQRQYFFLKSLEQSGELRLSSRPFNLFQLLNNQLCEVSSV